MAERSHRLQTGSFIAALLFVSASLMAPNADAKVTGLSSRAPRARRTDMATDATGVSDSVEAVRALWTETSRTYLQPDGTYEATVYPVPVNFENEDGAFQPIADKLVPSDDPDYDVENKAGPYAVNLPLDLADAPVRFESDGAVVNLTLRGAEGTGEVSGKKDTYQDVLPGVDVSYTATNTGVEETTTLADASAPATLIYSIETSDGLSAVSGPNGTIEFVDPFGSSQLMIPAPFAQDADGVKGPAAFTLSDAGDRLKVSVDGDWLHDPARAFPITVDPSITITGATTDCYITGGPAANTNFCMPSSTNKLLKVGYDPSGAKPSRSLLRFDLSAIPKTSTVVNAELGLHLSSATSPTPVSVEVHQVTQTNQFFLWTNAVTWKSPTGVINQLWTTPGGDFDPAVSWTTTSVGPAAGWYYWYPTAVVNGWVHGTTPNQGLILKLATENVSQVLSFDSTRTITSATKPVLTVVYHLWQGEEPYAPAVGFSLTERMGLQVDLRDGNLELHVNDVAIAGTGLPLVVDRYYNSKLGGAGDLGTSWFLAVATGIKLTAYPGSVDYRGPSGDHLAFTLNPNGSYASPAGADATLVKNGNGTFDLRFHASGERYHFGSNGRFLTDTDRNGNAITFTFSGPQLASITDTQGRVVTVSYNAAAFISQLADVTGRKWQYTYDANNDLVSYRDPAGGVTSYVYNTSHNLTQVTDPVGNVTKVVYTNGNVTKVIRVTNIATGTGPTTTFNYNTGNTAVTDSNGHVTTYYFDTEGRGTKVIDPAVNTFQASWSPDNHPSSLTDAQNHTTTATYDANDNLTQQVLPTGATTSWAFNDGAHPYSPTSMTDAEGHTTTYAYNAAGNLTSVTNALATQNTSTSTYNANGTTASITDPLGHVTSYTYDGAGNLTRITPPAPLGTTKFTYDALSRVATMTDGLGHVTAYTYDSLDRPTQTSFQGGPTVTDTYDGDGHLLSETDPSGTTSFVYNALGQPTTQTLPGGAQTTYAWDGEGNLLTVTDAGGTTTYTYNARDLPATLTQPGGAQTTFGYDANGQETNRTYPNGVFIQRTYDAAGRPLQIQNKKGSTVLAGYTYSYTGAGGVDTDLWQSVTPSSGTATVYTYDAINRLVEAKTGTSSDYQYSYDGVGNRLTQNVNGVVTNYTYNAANELTSAGGVTYTYDANGNQTGSSAALSLVYNNAWQTTSVTPPGGSATVMIYRGTGQAQRLTAGSTTFGYNLLGIASETTSGQTTRYVRDPGGGLVAEQLSAGTFYYLFDGAGSVVGLTNSSGTQVNIYSYEPYGRVASSSETVPNRWRFRSGYQDPATGLLKFGNRYLDTATGTWTQRDPMPSATSRFVYADGDPINNSDPTGNVVEPGGICCSDTHPAGHWIHVASGWASYDMEFAWNSEYRLKIKLMVPGLGGTFCINSDSPLYPQRCFGNNGFGARSWQRWQARHGAGIVHFTITFLPAVNAGLPDWYLVDVYQWSGAG